MEPRLKTSQKWSQFPKGVCETIQQSLLREFPNKEAEGSFIVEGWIYPEELILRTGYLEKGRIVQHNFEASIQFQAKKDNALNCIQVLMESCVSCLTNYFGGEKDFPREWRNFDLDGDDIYLRHTTFNSKLEAEADRLLGEVADDLVQQTNDSQIDEIINQLGIDFKETLH